MRVTARRMHAVELRTIYLLLLCASTGDFLSFSPFPSPCFSFCLRTMYLLWICALTDDSFSLFLSFSLSLFLSLFLSFSLFLSLSLSLSFSLSLFLFFGFARCTCLLLLCTFTNEIISNDDETRNGRTSIRMAEFRLV